MIRCLAAVLRAWWREAVLRRPRPDVDDQLAGHWIALPYPDVALDGIPTDWPDLDGPTIWDVEVETGDVDEATGEVEALVSYRTEVEVDAVELVEGDPTRLDGLCGAVVGPVWAAGGETWICEMPAGHAALGTDHAAGHLGNGIYEVVWSPVS